MADRRLNILTVLPYLPYPPDSGGKTRSFHLIRHLAVRDNIYLVSFIRNKEEARQADFLHPYCREVHVRLRNKARSLRTVIGHFWSDRTFYEEVYWLPAAGHFLRELFESRNIDVVHLECSYVGKYVRFLPPGRRFLVDHNIEYWIFDRFRETTRNPLWRFLLWLESRRVRQSEQQVWREADVCGAVSEMDRAEILRVVPQKTVWVLPNGAECPPRPAIPADPGVPRLLFTGNFTYFANIDAAFHLCREILPRIKAGCPNAELLLLGTGAVQKLRDLSAQEGVKIVDRVPDFAPYFADVAVFVCPLRIGSGTKLKVLEAMAAAKAIVSTAVGAEGLDVRDGEQMLIADDPQQFSSYVCRLLADPGWRARLGRSAYEKVRSQYSWQQIAEKVHQVYCSMLE
jgi:glycosyltransferase involved in cell wall biosynthesis